MEHRYRSRRGLLATLLGASGAGCTALSGDDGDGQFSVVSTSVEISRRRCGTEANSAEVSFGRQADPHVAVDGRIHTASKCDRLIVAPYLPSRPSDQIILRVRTVPTDDSCEECQGVISYSATVVLDEQPTAVDVYHDPNGLPSEQVAVARANG